MSKLIDLTGQRFGRLVVSNKSPIRVGYTRWVCQCDCGGLSVVGSQALRLGYTKSCGCLWKEAISGKNNHNYKYGGKSPAWGSWRKMKDRCQDPNNNRYKYYGAKGIKVCERWQEFTNFLADMGPRPVGTTLGRFLDRGNYEPGNCAWMTGKEQWAERRKAKNDGQ